MKPAASSGYAARLLTERERSAKRRAWALGGLTLGGLAAAAAAACRALAAHPVAQLAVAGYFAAEAAFFVMGKLRFRTLSQRSTAAPDTANLALHFERFLELRDVFCIRQFLSGWFMGAPADLVLRGNVEEFVAYGFHNRLPPDLSEAQRDQVVRFVDEAEAAWGVRFEPGFNADLPFMAHLWEPLRAYHKPLLMYAITEVLARTAHVLMILMGFRSGRQGCFTYWHAPPLAGRGSVAAGGSGGWQGGELSPPTSPLPPRRSSLGIRRHSTSEVVADAVHHAADAVHHAAEHALEATLTVTSTAVGILAAQHPHGGSVALSPRAPSPARPRPLSPSPPRGAAGPAGASGGTLRRRHKGDSAIDYACSALAAAAAEAEGMAEAEPAPEPAVPEPAPAPAAEMESDAEVRLLSPFRLAGAGPEQQAEVEQRRGACSPTDSAGSGLAGGGGGTRPDVPIVFLHGVGFGCLPYLHLIRDIQHACPNTPMIMVEVPHVALRLCWEAQGVDDVAHAVAAVVRRHGYRRACIVGHSYGTFVASRLCQLYKELVHSACLLDPVTMLTCYPQLLYNFVYKSPTAANFSSVGGAVDLIRFVCSRDLTIAQAFCRKFHWSELMLWPHDLPRRSLVVLSGQDDLVPSDLVMAHIKLTGHPAKVMHHPDLGHGGILLCPGWQAQIVAHLRTMLAC